MNPVDEAAAPPSTGEEPRVVDTPLFRSLRREELVAVIGGLRLLAFEPGRRRRSSGSGSGPSHNRTEAARLPSCPGRNPRRERGLAVRAWWHVD